jgi:uncharacterized membrane protein
MGIVNLILWLGGIVLIAIGYSRARTPWARYQALKEEDANASRYNAWRGGVREDSSATGASVAMGNLRREARQWAGLAVIGFVLVFLGFLIK